MPQSVPSLLHNLSYLILTAHLGDRCIITPASPDGEKGLDCSCSLCGFSELVSSRAGLQTLLVG